MEHHEISKLLKDLFVSKFVASKWIEVNDLSGSQYSSNKNIRIKTPMLRSDLRDYSDAHNVVKEKITVEGDDNVNNKISFENNGSFKSCISKINHAFVNNAEG